MIYPIDVMTKAPTEFVDVTSQIQELVGQSEVKEGICYLYTPHTTAAVTINESADRKVIEDIIFMVNEVIPFENNYRHLEGNSAAHIKASIIGPSETIPIENGRLLLGTWQGIFFAEFDGPRRRRLLVKIAAC
jgi:secondary thiamine-phosphate synthase enzyme